MAAYLAKRGAAMKSLDDLIAFNTDHAELELPWFGQEYFENSAKVGGLDSAEYLDARKKVEALRVAFTALMDKEGVDAVVATTNGPAWFIDLLNGDNYGQGCSGPAAITGFPHITIPGGNVRGLPVGFSFFGRANDEGKLIRLAYSFEQATRARRKPTYRKSSSPYPEPVA